MRLRRNRVNLVDRLRPYVDGGQPPEPMVSADPIRMFLYRWMIETGDPIEMVARGFDLDPEFANSLIEARVTCLTVEMAESVRSQLRVESPVVR